MTAKANEDIITGLTPLEERLANVHPRLYFTQQRITELKEQIKTDPWNSMFERVRHQAEEGSLTDACLVYQLTADKTYLDKGCEKMRELSNQDDRPRLFDLALAYDWLYHDLDDETRDAVKNCLERHGRAIYETLAKQEMYWAGTYACNQLASLFSQTAAAAFAVYGDVENVGPWLRFIMEKTRLMTDSLGHDGASAEGICYGGVYTAPYIEVVVLVQELLGWDFFKNNEYLRNVPYFYLSSMIARNWINPQSVHLCFGDGVRYNWYGPGFFLRKLASVYQNPRAQWVADVQQQAGVSKDPSCLGLLWYDPAVPAESPDDFPTFRHFDDKDLVIMRSRWNGDESVFGFWCGPHAGHYALQNYQQCIGGGHMAPGAGSFLLFAHGDWLISDGWYARKFTEYRNTVLINGIGQTGATKGIGTDWFECTELRREKRAPSIISAEPGEEYDYIIGNVAPAYEHKAGLKKFLRHVLYVKPYCWVIVDELETKQPAVFDLFFHAFGEYFQTDRPFRSTGKNAWTTGGKNGALQITALLPDNVEGFAEIQAIKGIGAHNDREMNILRLRNGSKTNTAIFVTVLESYPASGSPEITPAIETDNDNTFLALDTPRRKVRFVFEPGQEDIAAPVFQSPSPFPLPQQGGEDLGEWASLDTQNK